MDHSCTLPRKHRQVEWLHCFNYSSFTYLVGFWRSRIDCRARLGVPGSGGSGVSVFLILPRAPNKRGTSFRVVANISGRSCRTPRACKLFDNCHTWIIVQTCIIVKKNNCQTCTIVRHVQLSDMYNCQREQLSKRIIVKQVKLSNK